jgi:exosortase
MWGARFVISIHSGIPCSMSRNLSRRHLYFIVFVLASFVLSCTPLRKLLGFAVTHDYGSHIVLIGPVSAYLVYLKRREVFSKVQTDAVTGSGLFLAGAVSWSVAHYYSPLHSDLFSLEIATIIVLWISGFIFCYGSQAFRAARFPLLFLMLLVPIPSCLLDKTIFFLQSGSAAVAYWLLRVLNVPVLKDGFVLFLPTLKLEVAKECSGIRTSLALLITTLLAGEFVLHSVWKKSLLVLSTIPILIVKNGVRIVTVSLLTIYVDRGFLHGWLHMSGGMVFYLFGLLILIPIMIVLRRWEIKSDIAQLGAPVLPCRGESGSGV